MNYYWFFRLQHRNGAEVTLTLVISGLGLSPHAPHLYLPQETLTAPPPPPSRPDSAPCHHLDSFNVRDEESSVLKKHIGTLFLPKTFEILSTEHKHGYHERKVL